MNASQLLKHFDRLAEAPDAVARLRRFILDLAVRGKLVEQDEEDETVISLLSEIRIVKTKLYKEGKIKNIQNLQNVAPEDVWFSTPSGWYPVHLGAVTNIVMGQSPPGSSYNKSQDGVPLINGPVEFTLGPFGKTVTNQHTTAPTNFCDLGDMLICVRGSTTGRTNIAGFRACIGRGVAAIQPFFSDQFVRLCLVSMRPKIIEMGRGIAFPSVNKEQIARLVVPLPPLAEQHRIVAKVNELMSLCDQLEAAQQERERCRDRLAAASLQRLNQPAADAAPEEQREHARFHLNHLPRLITRPEQIKAMRQLLLDLAVRGKLLSQNSNDEPATELLRKIQIEKLKQQKIIRKKEIPLPEVDLTSVPFELPNGWAWARFPEVGLFGRGKSKHRPRNDPSLFDGGSHLLVQTGDVARSKGVIKTFTSKYNDVGLAQSMKWPAGTLCITIAANIADSGILTFDACFPDSVVGFKASPLFDSARYFEYFVRTAKANLLAFAPATAQKNINLEILNAVLIPLPPLAEQHRIVAKVDELMALCDKLEAQLTITQTDSRRLLEAVLEHAL